MSAKITSCFRVYPWIILFCCLTVAKNLFAQDASVYKVPPKPRPASIIALDPVADYALVVDKSGQTLRVYDNAFKLVQTFPITTGKATGDKTQKDDLKTPEGIYFFTNVMEKKELASQYGLMAMSTNYPNMYDQHLQKTGGGIWLHAVDFRKDEIKQFETKGCIAASNENILAIASFVTLEETPLIVVEKIRHELPDRLRKEEQAITDLLQTWKTARENQDVETYMGLYSDQASIMGMGRGELEQDIRQTIKEYEFVRLKIEKVRILNHDSYAVASCVQELQTSRFQNRGVKRFYLVRQKDAWKILREEWREQSSKRPGETARKLVQLVTRKDPKTGASREGWFLAQDPARFAIQLVGVSSEERLIGYLKEQKLSRNVGFFRTSHEGQDWYVVVYGNYANMLEAREARDKLPGNLSAAAPWVRSFQSIQDSIIAPYN